MMHDVTSRSRTHAVVALAVALVLVAGGCSGDDGSDAGGSSSPSASDTSLPSSADLTAYFSAVAGYDADGLDAAAGTAADGSPAQAYARFQAAITRAAAAGNQPFTPAAVTPTDDGFKACGDQGTGSQCATWTDLQGDDGRLSNFDVGDVDLADSLIDLTGQPAISPDGVFTAQPLYAYRSPLAQDLDVLVSVTATDAPLEVLSHRAIYVEKQVILDGADSRSLTTVEPGATVVAILRFPDSGKAALDGQVTMDVTVADATHQSVGFGLSDTAP